MKKFEYRREYLGMLSRLSIDDIGNQGWELVAIYAGEGWFKRELIEKRK